MLKFTIRFSALFAIAFTPFLEAVAAGSGLRADYYTSETAANPAVTRIDASLNFDWKAKSKDIGLSAALIRWSGSIEAPVTGVYTFRIRSSKLAKLSVADRVVIDGSALSIKLDKSGSVSLEGGRRYNIDVQFPKKTGAAEIKLTWKRPKSSDRLIEKNYLYPEQVVAAPPATPEPSAGELTIDLPFEKSNAYEQIKVRGKCASGSSVNVYDNGRLAAQALSCVAGSYSGQISLPSGAPARKIEVSRGPASTVEASVSVNRVERCTLQGTQLPSSAMLSLDVKSMPEKTWSGQNEGDGSWLFYFNSSNSQYVDIPTTGYYVFRTQARSTTLGKTFPKMQIAIDGRVHSETDVKASSLAWYSSEDPTSLVEAFPITAGRHKISIGFGNWNKAVGESRYQNLAVKEVRMYAVSSDCVTPAQNLNLSAQQFKTMANARGLRVGAVLDTGIAPGGNYINVFKQDYKNVDFLKTMNHVMPGSSFLMDRLNPSEGVYNFTESDEVVDFAQTNQMTLTAGHLAWFHFVPQWLVAKNPSAAETKSYLQNHIKTVMSRYKGRVKYWIVVNEAFADDEGFRKENFWYQKLGADFIKIAFEAARAADPSAVLMYNDYDIDEMGRKSDAVYAHLSMLKSQGVPIDAIGFQAHLKINQPLFLKSMVENFDRFAKLGLRVHLSETDVAIPTPLAGDAYLIQAEHYRNTLKACLMTPACELYLMFGTIDRYWWYQSSTYTAGAVLFNDYSEKPALKLIRNALYGLDPL